MPETIMARRIRRRKNVQFDRLARVIGLAAWLCGGCVPIDSELGGTRPPPDVNGDGSNGLPTEPPPPETDADVLVFDVTISAVSRNVSGISVNGTLTVDRGDDDLAFDEITLRDDENTFDGEATVGTSGGLFVTASGTAGEPSAESFFELSVGDDGTVQADFADPGDASNPNVFILQEESGAFQPGQIGVTFRIQSGSDFSFRIDGQDVSGQINLNGVPARTGGVVDFYVGTFTGTLRR